jgi:hypothetical protein
MEARIAQGKVTDKAAVEAVVNDLDLQIVGYSGRESRSADAKRSGPVVAGRNQRSERGIVSADVSEEGVVGR